MRDIPAIVWILAVFFVLAIGTFIYSKTGPEDLPQTQTVWAHLEGLRDNLQFRRFKLDVGQLKEGAASPYEFSIQRLANQNVRSLSVAQYIFTIRPVSKIPMEKPWIGAGLEMGLIDTKPSDLIGDVRLISLHKLEAAN